MTITELSTAITRVLETGWTRVRLEALAGNLDHGTIDPETVAAACHELGLELIHRAGATWVLGPGAGQPVKEDA